MLRSTYKSPALLSGVSARSVTDELLLGEFKRFDLFQVKATTAKTLLWTPQNNMRREDVGVLEVTDNTSSLMRSLDRAVQQGNPAQLLIGGTGSVSVYPRQHCYVTDINDWDAVYVASAEQIRLGPALWAAPPAGALPLEELQWRAAMHSAQAVVAGGSQQAVPRALVHLVSWPNLTRLPEDLVASVTRICALLWRKPTVGYLVVRMLDLPAERTAIVLRALRMMGHVHWAESAHEGASDERPSGMTESQLELSAPASGRAAGELRLISRLWQRLTGA